MKIDINGDRLWESVHEYAKIGATAKGGVKRMAFSQLDYQARDQFIDECLELNMSISRDTIGNIFATMMGENPDLPVVMVGSHLDTQPTGGKYDGALGVLSALEIAKSVYEAGNRPKRGLQIVAFANEEGGRFAPAMMGSGVFVGKLDLAEMMAKKDIDGMTVAEELGRDSTGDYPTRPETTIDSMFEIHIEQGPILEEEGLSIGAVTGAQAQRWYDVTIIGSEAHAGPTPMTSRKDAGLGAAELSLAIEQIALEHGPDGRGTVGVLVPSPASRNVIPGSVYLTIDTRHPSDESLLAMKSDIQNAIKSIEQKRGLEIALTEIWHSPATPFDEGLVERLEYFAAERGYPIRRIWSGAGHDAVYVAQMNVPTVMVFTQTKDGISHNESESIKKEDAIIGCQVLADAVCERLFQE
ncbi:MAG: Zn-dependent hydrolase [Chloroflexota bacterium]